MAEEAGSRSLRIVGVYTILVTLVFSGGYEAAAAASRSDYSLAQQKKIYDEGIRLCRAKLRTHLNFIKVDYKRKRYICYPEPSSANRQNHVIKWTNPS